MSVPPPGSPDDRNQIRAGSRSSGNQRHRAAEQADEFPRFAPDTADEALLRFVLTDDASMEQLRSWRGLVELDDASGHTYGLLPAFYKRLESVSPTDPDIGRLRGVYRHQWTASQRHLAASQAAETALTRSGVEFIGSPDQHVAASLPEPGTLPLAIPRITVPYERTGAAVEALLGAGWRFRTSPGSRQSLRSRLIRTDWEMEADDGATIIVVGNHFNPWIRDDTRDARVWERSTPAETAAWLPHHTDLFVRILVDTPRDRGALRWAIGAVAVARAQGRLAHLESVLGNPAARYLLPCIESRLEFLDSIDDGRPAVREALTETQALLQRPVPPPARRGPVGRQVAHRVRQVGVLARSVRRYGGVLGTARYLRRSRR